MRRILLFVTLSLLATVPTLASEVVTDAGTTSVLFGFQGLDNLALINYRGGVGMRWYPADNWALRPGISYGWSEVERPADEHNDIQYSGSKTSNDSFGFSLILERRLAAAGVASPYVGLGVEHNSATSTSVPALPGDPVDGTRLKSVRRQQGWTGLLVGGIEFGLLERLTAGAEYRLSYRSETYETEYYLQNMPSDVDEETRRSAGVGAASFYVSVGF